MMSKEDAGKAIDRLFKLTRKEQLAGRKPCGGSNPPDPTRNTCRGEEATVINRNQTGAKPSIGTRTAQGARQAADKATGGQRGSGITKGGGKK